MSRPRARAAPRARAGRSASRRPPKYDYYDYEYEYEYHYYYYYYYYYYEYCHVECYYCYACKSLLALQYYNRNNAYTNMNNTYYMSIIVIVTT